MTLQELIAAVRENIQDPSALRWSDALITRYLNEGMRILAPFSYSLTYWESAFAAEQASVARPPQLLVPNKAAFKQDDDEWGLVLRQGMPDIPESVRGYPTSAFFLADSIHLRPVPDRSGVLKVSGTARPTDMVNSADTPSLVDCEPVLVPYATWLCLAADGDPTAQVWRELFEQRRREWMIFDSMRNPQRSEIRESWWW